MCVCHACWCVAVRPVSCAARCLLSLAGRSRYACLGAGHVDVSPSLTLNGSHSFAVRLFVVSFFFCCSLDRNQQVVVVFVVVVVVVVVVARSHFLDIPFRCLTLAL